MLGNKEQKKGGMMTEERFKSVIDEDTMSVMPYLVSDNEEECFYKLQGCVDLLNEQQATIKKQDIEIQSLNLHIEKLVDGDEISQLLMREYERSDGLEKENEQLHKRYNNLGQAIVKTCNDLNRTEEVYLADFNICKRITEYEKELDDDD